MVLERKLQFRQFDQQTISRRIRHVPSLHIQQSCSSVKDSKNRHSTPPKKIHVSQLAHQPTGYYWPEGEQANERKCSVIEMAPAHTTTKLKLKLKLTPHAPRFGRCRRRNWCESTIPSARTSPPSLKLLTQTHSNSCSNLPSTASSS